MGDWAFIAGDADTQLCFFAPPTKGTQHLQVSTTSEASPGVLLAGNRLQCAQRTGDLCRTTAQSTQLRGRREMLC